MSFRQLTWCSKKHGHCGHASCESEWRPSPCFLRHDPAILDAGAGELRLDPENKAGYKTKHEQYGRQETLLKLCLLQNSSAQPDISQSTLNVLIFSP